MKKQYKKHKWSKKESDFVKENYEKMSILEIANELNLTYQSVASKVGYYRKYISKGEKCPTGTYYYKLRIEKEKQQKQEILEENSKLLSQVELKTKHKKHKQPKKKVPNVWNEEELEFLKNNYSKLTRKNIAEFLNKSESHVHAKIMELGLRKTKKRGPAYKWTKEEDLIIENIAKLKILSKKEKFSLLNESLPHRTNTALKNEIKKLGLFDEFSTKNISSLELKIKEFLKENNIIFEQQYLLPNSLYRVDFFIKEKNLIIEILGDYWHCNPEIYSKPKDDIQAKKILSDKKKMTFIKSNNYNILCFWENDILNKYDQVKKEILIHF
jgi:very-short-patch-repair endonuclease